jgi:anti-sigma factor RsiW
LPGAIARRAKAMTCQEARHHCMLYLDSEGDPELHLRISDHLAMCPACAEWFTQQQRFEQALSERLGTGQATPELWDRALTRAGLRAPVVSRRRWLVLGGARAAAAVLLGVAITLWTKQRPHPSDLGQIAANWHEQLLRGDVHPEVESTSDKIVEDHLRKKVSFHVHCPPRKDAHFALQGAGVCRVKGKQAAYIVGQVDRINVSILVLDRSSLDAFPHERDHLAQGGGRHRCREGNYQMVSGLIADNLVVVIGKASPQALETVLNAYGSYHEET